MDGFMYRLFGLILCLSCTPPYVAPVVPKQPALTDEDEPAPTSRAVLQPKTKETPTTIAVVPEAPKEPRPEVLGTPASSKKARPAWSSDSDYAPQYGWELPERVIEAETLSEAMLVCDVDTSGVSSQDFFGGKNEISITLSLGKSSIQGNFKSSRVYAPLVSIKSGDSFSLKVYDIDYLSANDPIEFLKVKYKGKWPITAEGKLVSYRCYAVLREEIEAKYQEHVKVLDKELLALEKIAAPNLFDVTMPRIEPFAPTAKQHAETLASLVGWDDPRVVSRVSKINALEAKHKETLLQSIKEVSNTSYPLGQSISRANNFSVTPNLSCDKKNATTYKKFDDAWLYLSDLKKSTCVIELQIKNEGVEPIKSEYRLSPFDDVSAISPNGDSLDFYFVAVRTDDGLVPREKFSAIEVGQTVTFVLIGRSPKLGGKKPSEKTPLLLRLVLDDRKEPFVWYVKLREP
jgi:hypothetical protein